MPSVNLLSSFQSSTNEVSYQAVDSKNGDNFESGVHTIRRKPVSSSSLRSIGSHGSSVDSQKSATTGISARTLSRDYLELISSILVLALPLPFFALAVYSAHVDGKHMKQDQWLSIQGYMKVFSIPDLSQSVPWSLTLRISIVRHRIPYRFRRNSWKDYEEGFLLETGKWRTHRDFGTAYRKHVSWWHYSERLFFEAI
jgi:hypothetical protein